MVILEELGLCELIWKQYQAGRDKKHVLIKIHAEPHLDHVSQLTVDRWYKWFQSGASSLFDLIIEKYQIPWIIQILPNGYKILIFKE
jgi:hypothetical protein